MNKSRKLDKSKGILLEIDPEVPICLEKRAVAVSQEENKSNPATSTASSKSDDGPSTTKGNYPAIVT
jgi:hypothetical protein